MVPVYRIAISPGHGGRAELGRRTTGDHWCALRGKFIKGYNSGTFHKNVTEEKVVLDISKRLKDLLDLTRTDKGWEKFRSLLEKASPKGKFKRVVLDTMMTRDSSYDTHPLRKAPNSNKYFRMFDSPTSFTGKDQTPGKLHPGRLSMINSFKPHLVVPVHLDTSGTPSYGGFHTVLTPPYSAFKSVAESYAKGGSAQVRKIDSPFLRKWSIKAGSRNRDGWALLDTTTYFYGYFLDTAKQTLSRKFNGLRFDMVTWTFMDKGGSLTTPFRPARVFRQYPSGRFWKREASRFEERRRGFSPVRGSEDSGYGGDNHHGGDELIRFVRYWIYRNLAKPPEEKTKWPDQDTLAGPIQRPAISDYSEPMLVNGVVAFLELGFMSNNRDRELIFEHPQLYAEGIAIGIYSLFEGLKVQPWGIADSLPTGRPVDWDYYRLSAKEKSNFFGLDARKCATYFETSCRLPEVERTRDKGAGKRKRSGASPPKGGKR